MLRVKRRSFEHLTDLVRLAVGVAIVPVFMSGAQAQESKSTWTSSVLKGHCAEIFPAVRAAAGSNDPAALETEAAMYDRGCGVVQNMRRAEELYTNALAQGAKDGLAAGYVDLYGPNPSEEQGISRLREAANAGNRLAAFELYFYYLHRFRDESDSTVAFHWASTAAHSGDLIAEADLAGMYLQGTGVEENFPVARELIEKGMAANVPDAFMYAGIARFYGLCGYTKDHAEGISLLRKAIALGLTRAKVVLSLNADKTDLAEGRVTRDELTSFVESAASLMLPRRFYDFEVGEYWYYGPGDVHDCARAVPLLLEFVDSSSADPVYELGYCYYNGDGIPVNNELGLKYMRLAAQRGSQNAIAIVNSYDASQSRSRSNSTVDSMRDYEGYHWNELHPMSSQPATGPH